MKNRKQKILRVLVLIVILISMAIATTIDFTPSIQYMLALVYIVMIYIIMRL